MTKECEHKWVKLYYRKQLKKEWASWVIIKDTFFCEKCGSIRVLKDITKL